MLHRRECGPFKITLRTSESSQTLSIGQDSIGTVFFAEGAVDGPEGERLRTADPICEGEKGAAVPNLYTNLDSELRLHVGERGVLWVDLAPNANPFLSHAAYPTQPDQHGFAEIYDPGTNLRVQGDLTAPQLVLALASGRTVSQKPPDAGEHYPAWRSPVSRGCDREYELGLPRIERVRSGGDRGSRK